jgi:hypothetical protein
VNGKITRICHSKSLGRPKTSEEAIIEKQHPRQKKGAEAKSIGSHVDIH